jgi:ABC-2 type transport system ATP-binding protein
VNGGGPDSAPALAVRGLTHWYGPFVAVDSLDLEVSAGELVALVGPNGAGKTTLLSAAAGLLEPSEGSLEVMGAPAGSIAARSSASYVPDTPVFYDDLSLDEHLDYVAGLHGVADGSGRSEGLLERFGLEEWGDSLPAELSRGMRQKASIAVGLVRPFSLLLVDEPFAGLDAASRPVLRALLREQCEGGAAAIVTTHDAEIAAAADRCVALEDGRLAYDGEASPAAIASLFTGG